MKDEETGNLGTEAAAPPNKRIPPVPPPPGASRQEISEFADKFAQYITDSLGVPAHQNKEVNDIVKMLDAKFVKDTAPFQEAMKVLSVPRDSYRQGLQFCGYIRYRIPCENHPEGHEGEVFLDQSFRNPTRVLDEIQEAMAEMPDHSVLDADVIPFIVEA